MADVDISAVEAYIYPQISMPNDRLQRARVLYDGYEYDPPATWCRCGRNKHIHSEPFNLDNVVKQQAQALADDIDRRIVEQYFAEIS